MRFPEVPLTRFAEDTALQELFAIEALPDPLLAWWSVQVEELVGVQQSVTEIGDGFVAGIRGAFD